MQTKPKLLRTATVATSLDILLKGQLRFLHNYFEVKAISGQDNHLTNVKNREGVEVINIPMTRQISLWNDLVSLNRLYVTIKKEKPQIVHSITPKAGLLSMTAAWLARVPIRMHTFTGLVFPTQTGVMQKLLIKMDQLLCRMATHIYPEGQGVKNDLLAYNITKKPLKILANGNVSGIDTTFFDPTKTPNSHVEAIQKEWNIQENDFVFIYVGRLVGDKGINELIAAFTNLQPQASQSQTEPNPTNKLKLLLVGNYEHQLDPLHQSTLDAIYENPNIIAVGYQEDIRPFLAVSDVFVFPSYREGFPNVVLQAGAMGLPCIVTDINGSNEIIVEGINGTIIPPKNANALENAMQKLKDNFTFSQSLAQNARERITSRYEQQVVWDALLAEYQMLID